MEPVREGSPLGQSALWHKPGRTRGSRPCQAMSRHMVFCSLRIPSTMKDAGMTGSQTPLPKQRSRTVSCDRPMVAKTSLSALDLSALKVRALVSAKHSSHRVATAAQLWKAECPHRPLSKAKEARRVLRVPPRMLLLHLSQLHL